MSRDLTAANIAQVDAPHLHEVVLVKLDFDVPAYAHSGIGTITYAGDDYLGVGDFGTISNATESERLGPTSLTLQMSGIDSQLLTEALDSGTYGDVVTIYIGYRQDDGTLVDDPWILWRGTFDHATISQGESNGISITLQHDLAILGEKDGGRFTDEDQQRRFAGDTGFSFVTDMASVKLPWGGGNVIGSVYGAQSDGRPRQEADQIREPD